MEKPFSVRLPRLTEMTVIYVWIAVGIVAGVWIFMRVIMKIWPAPSTILWPQ